MNKRKSGEGEKKVKKSPKDKFIYLPKDRNGKDFRDGFTDLFFCLFMGVLPTVK